MHERRGRPGGCVASKDEVWGLHGVRSCPERGIREVWGSIDWKAGIVW